jgi:hypothetical protein
MRKGGIAILGSTLHALLRPVDLVTISCPDSP